VPSTAIAEPWLPVDPAKNVENSRALPRLFSLETNVNPEKLAKGGGCELMGFFSGKDDDVVVPTTYALFDLSNAIPFAYVLPAAEGPDRYVEYESAEPLELNLVINDPTIPAGRKIWKAPGVVGKFAEEVVPTRYVFKVGSTAIPVPTSPGPPR